MGETEAMAAIIGFVMSAIVVFFLAFIITSILMIVGMWKMFTKANNAGWKALIPVYNQYILCKIAKVPLLFIGIVVCAVLVNFNDYIVIIGLIGAIVVNVFLCINLAKVFNKSGLFAVGLIFFPYIFYLILAFGSATYVKE
ncbi:MAG: DUF5684 domain-containing protein [Bacilli bacterium]